MREPRWACWALPRHFFGWDAFTRLAAYDFHIPKVKLVIVISVHFDMASFLGAQSQSRLCECVHTRFVVCKVYAIAIPLFSHGDLPAPTSGPSFKFSELNGCLVACWPVSNPSRSSRFAMPYFDDLHPDGACVVDAFFKGKFFTNLGGGGMTNGLLPLATEGALSALDGFLDGAIETVVGADGARGADEVCLFNIRVLVLAAAEKGASVPMMLSLRMRGSSPRHLFLHSLFCS